MNIVKNEDGVAILTAMMLLVLISSFYLFAFQNAATEKMIAIFSQKEATSLSVAESGIEQLLAWFTDPTLSPDPVFFEERICTKENPELDFSYRTSLSDISSGYFSDVQEIGGTIDLRLYKSSHNEGICAVETKVNDNKWMKVDLSQNPMKPITAGVQGMGTADLPATVFVHWGVLRYLGDVNLGESVTRIPEKDETRFPNGDSYLEEPTEENPNVDPFLTVEVSGQIVSPQIDDERPNVSQGNANVTLDSVDMDKLKQFIKRFGRYFIISKEGTLEENGIDLGSFNDIFLLTDDTEETSGYALVFIDNIPDYSSPDPLEIGSGAYKGYFYFSGDIRIVGGGVEMGRSVLAYPPPPPSGPLLENVLVSLNDVHLDGLFYTSATIVLEDTFRVYGAIFAGSGLEGEGADLLEVWYNSKFQSAIYPGVVPLIRIPGTWQTM